MPALRSARRRRAIVASASRFAKPLALTQSLRLEPLENRVFLCASVQDLIANGIPAAYIRDDGHITQANYDKLSAAQKLHVDPHMVEGSVAPVNFDQILGIPASVSGEPGLSGVADVLPDFFPQLDSAISVDQTSQSGRTLLRFGTQVNNQGHGPAILISGRPGVDPIPAGAPITSWTNPDGSQNVLQAIYNYDNSRPFGQQFQLSHYRAGGLFTYHAGHAHFHYDGYANYRLRHNVGGQPGAVVMRTDGTGAVGEKTGFCLINTSSSFTMENGFSSTTLPGYSASSPYNGQPSTGCGLLQGVRVGQADEYSSGLEGQWIDVTGVPNGNYFVEIAMDGENAILESNETNNAKTWAYNLNVNPPAGGITPDEYDDQGQHNDTFATATNMDVLGTFTKTGMNINWGQDFDYFRFVASSSGVYNVSTTPANGNVDLYLFDGAENQIAASTSPSGTDTVSYNFVAGQTYYAMAQSYNSTTSSNYQIAWSLKPTVNNTSPSRTVAEESTTGSYFTIARNGPTTTSLVVPLTISGNAVAGVDYQALPTSVTFDVLTSSIDIPLFPIDNQVANSKRTVTVTVQGTSTYVIGAGVASITIVDADSGRRGGTGLTPASEMPAATLTRASSRVGNLFSNSLLGDDRDDAILADALL